MARDLNHVPVVEVWSLNHWATREVPMSNSYLRLILTSFFVKYPSLSTVT